MIHAALKDQGHTFALAARELWNVHHAFSGTPVQYYQAPFKQGPTPLLATHECHAHLLYSAGYADPQELTVLVSAWIGVLGSFRPDLVIFDHSPTALLASRCLPVRRVIIGSGFLVPTKGQPMGVLPDAPTGPGPLSRMTNDEAAVLGNINKVLAAFGLEKLDALQDMYAVADDEVLLTSEELDPFRRGPVDYSSVWPARSFPEQNWPEHSNRRIFAYLDDFPGLKQLLTDLESLDATTLIYAPGIPSKIRDAHTSARLEFLDGPTNLEHLAKNATCSFPMEPTRAWTGSCSRGFPRS